MSAPLSPRALLLASLLFAPAALAEDDEPVPPLENTGRISVAGGWRLTPNDLFRRRLAEAGFELGPTSRGGPALAAVFGYSVNPLLEVAVDLLAGGEQLSLAGDDRITSITYGGLLGLRFQSATDPVGPFAALVPSIGFQTGAMLVNVEGPNESSESVTQAFVLSAGLAARLSPRWGIGVEYRFLLARGAVPGVGSINAGGNWVTVGVTYFFPPEEGHSGSRTRW